MRRVLAGGAALGCRNGWRCVLKRVPSLFRAWGRGRAVEAWPLGLFPDVLSIARGCHHAAPSGSLNNSGKAARCPGGVVAFPQTGGPVTIRSALALPYLAIIAHWHQQQAVNARIAC
jgi:hypothetical protein